MVELLKVVWGVCVCVRTRTRMQSWCLHNRAICAISVSFISLCGLCCLSVIYGDQSLCACAITTSDLWILPFPARHPAQAWKEGQWYKTRAKLYWISSLLSKTSISEHVLHPTETSPEHKVQNRKGTKLSGGSEPTEITGGVRGWNVVLVTGWSRHRNGLRK